MPRKPARNTRQPGLEVEASGKAPGWVSEDLVCCGKGPLNGQWFTRQQWEQRLRSQVRMRELGSEGSRDALEYVVTHEEVPHPTYPWKTGLRAVLKPSLPT